MTQKGFGSYCPKGFWDADTARTESLSFLQNLSEFRNEIDSPFAGLSKEIQENLAKISLEMDQEMFERESKGPASYEIPLFCAAESGNVPCVELLIQAGADPHIRDNANESALYASGSPEVVDLLVEHGLPIEDENYLGWSPLISKISDGEDAMPVVLALIKAGANVNATHDRGYSVFMSAVAGILRSRKSLMTLVEAGADPHAVSDLGYNAFHAAVDVNGEANSEQSVREVLGYLKELGVDLEGRTKSGLTPLARALCEGTAIETQVLCELGADVNAIAKMHSCGPSKCEAVDLPLIFHAATGIGVDSPEKTESLLRHGADPTAIDPNGCSVLTIEISNLCFEAGNKSEETFQKIYDGLVSLDTFQWIADRDLYVANAKNLFLPMLEEVSGGIPIESDSEYAASFRQDALKTIAILAAYTSWHQKRLEIESPSLR